MSPENARAVRRARLARLLQEEPGLTRKEMAQRLGLKKDTLRRDLAALEEERAGSAEQSVQNAPALGGADRERAPALPAPQVSDAARAHSAPGSGEEAHRAHPAQLPRGVPGEVLSIDLRQWPGLRRDLAVLAQTGCSAEELVVTAVRALTVGYRQGLEAGDVRPHRPFAVTRMAVAPLALAGPRVPPASMAGA